MFAFRPIRAATVLSAAIASVMLFAATEPAQAFKRGPVMRPMTAQPMIAKPHYGGMTDVGYTVTVTDTQTGMRRRPLMGAKAYGGMTNVRTTITVTDTDAGRMRRLGLRNANANTSDPGNVEVVLKVLDGRPAPTMRPGKFRVIEREPLRSNFRGVDQVYIPTR